MDIESQWDEKWDTKPRRMRRSWFFGRDAMEDHGLCNGIRDGDGSKPMIFPKFGEVNATSVCATTTTMMVLSQPFYVSMGMRMES